MNNIFESLQMWWTTRQYKKKKEETIKKTGWESKCVKCGRLYFTDDSCRFICDSGTHWHYQCTGCGYKSKHLLSIMPLYAGESDAVVRRLPYYDLGEFYIFFGELFVCDSQNDSIVCELVQNHVEMGIPVLKIAGDDKIYANYDFFKKTLLEKFPRPVQQILHINAKSAVESNKFVRLKKEFQLSCDVGNSLQVFAHTETSVLPVAKDSYTQLELNGYIDVRFHELPEGCTKVSFLIEI